MFMPQRPETRGDYERKERKGLTEKVVNHYDGLSPTLRQTLMARLDYFACKDKPLTASDLDTMRSSYTTMRHLVIRRVRLRLQALRMGRA